MKKDTFEHWMAAIMLAFMVFAIGIVVWGTLMFLASPTPNAETTSKEVVKP